MSSATWNLVAAILCTAAAGFSAIAAYLSEPTLVNTLALVAGALGTLGGIAWIVAAAMGVRRS